jgi:membrane protein
VEDEAGRSPVAHHGNDRSLVRAGHREHVSIRELGVDLRNAAPFPPERGSAVEQLPHGTREDGATGVRDAHRSGQLAVCGDERGRLDLRRDLDEIRESPRRVHLVEAISEDWGVTIRRRELVHKFFADRGTHLAAMVAYFALLSFVPLIFLALSLFGLAHRADASDFFIRELKHAFPGTSVDVILKLVHRVQDNAAALGIIGAIGLAWSSLSFFSSLESALNIVYGVPNRRFLHGKLLAAVLAVSVLVTLFVSLVVGAFGVTVLKHHLGAFADSSAVAYALSIAASLVGVFVFLLVVYYWLPNTDMTIHDALPGAVWGAIVLEASFQALPIFVRLANVNVTLRTLGGPAILLLWLYLMANVIVFGGEVNWWWRERFRERAAAREQHEPDASALPSTRPPAPQPSAPRPPE